MSIQIADQKITVVGLGKSGFAAAKFLIARKAKVRATDSSQKQEVLEHASYLTALGVEVETGGHSEGFLRGSDLVVTSPGVPKHSLPLVTARKHRIPVISEVELAFHHCRGRVVAVTGSNGKTTTCHLIHRILVESGRSSVLCGNVGYSFLDAVSEIDKKTTVVLELSSFQLEDSPGLRPDIAVVLNVSPNHLDRHKTLDRYRRAKEQIFKNQKAKDSLILNYEDPLTRGMAKKCRSQVIFYSKQPLKEGIFCEGGAVKRMHEGKLRVLAQLSNLHLKGAHNQENIMAAVAVAEKLKLPKRGVQKALEAFRTLEHRIEPVGEVRGVTFVNDSKSTTLASTRAAILSICGPIVLIAGGRDKGAPFGEIEGLLKEKVKRAVLYGEARDKIASLWRSYVGGPKTEKFEEAVHLAFAAAVPGDTVLLSPMCTSFDQFSSFEERGEAFKKIYKKIRAAQKGASWKR